MLPARSWDMIRARQRRATLKRRAKMIDRKERRMQAFGAFVRDLVFDLNQMSGDGWSVLVEGQRDAKAVRKLGYAGRLVTLSSVSRSGAGAFGESKKVIILTDLDREGAVLASSCLKALSHDGLRTSLSERRRLKRASRGVFLHIENLSRFAEAPSG